MNDSRESVSNLYRDSALRYNFMTLYHATRFPIVPCWLVVCVQVISRFVATGGRFHSSLPLEISIVADSLIRSSIRDERSNNIMSGKKKMRNSLRPLVWFVLSSGSFGDYSICRMEVTNSNWASSELRPSWKLRLHIWAFQRRYIFSCNFRSKISIFHQLFSILKK